METSTSTLAVESTSSVVAPTECAPWVREMVSEFVEDRGLVGVAAVVEVPGCSQEVAVGLSELADEVPLRTDEVFRIASISKTFTAVAALALADAEVLALDDPVSAYLEGDFGDITIEQLLSHTSGLVDVESDAGVFELLMNPAMVLDRWASIEDSLGSSVRQDPGSIHRYANVNFVIAGYVIEAATDKTFEDIMEEFVLGPLGLDSTGIETAETVMPDPHERPSPASDPIAVTDLPTGLVSASAWSAGGMVSTLDDIVVFAEGVFGGGLISEQALAAMVDGSSGARAGYGLGVNTGAIDGHLYHGHNGRIVGFASSFRHVPESGLTVVVLSNDGTTDAPVLADELLRTALRDVG